MLIEIKSRYGGKLLHSIEAETVRDAIVQLVKIRADLRGADLSGAYLSGAYLRGADLRGAKISWQSHALLAEILRRSAGGDIEKRKIAGLIAISLDWCWDAFLAIESDLRVWALTELAVYITPDDNHPTELDPYVKTEESAL